MWNTFVNFLVKSSANPEETSLTITGILISYASTVVSVLTVLNISVTYNIVVHYISTGGIVIGCLLSIFGIGRKLYFIIKGTPDPDPALPVTPVSVNIK